MTIDIGTYGAPGATPEPVAPHRPPERRRRPRRWLATGLALLLAADVLVLGVHVGAGDDGPAAAVRSFARALVVGDGAAAAAAVDPPPGDSRLTAADVQAGSLGRTGVVVVSRSGSAASARLTLDGTDLLLTLRRSGGSLLDAPRWRITSGLPSVTVRAPTYEPEAVVDGRPVTLRDGSAQLVVFPGEVTAGLALAAPADAVSVTRSVLADTSLVLAPGVDQATQATLSQSLSFRVIRGGQVPVPDSGGFVHPSHVDVDHVELAADGRTLTFAATLDQLIRVQNAYNRPTLHLVGTATYAPGGTVTVTSLTTTPIS